MDASLKRALRRCAAALLCTWSLAAAAYHDGALLPPEPPPQRIVSLLPSATETVCALGACGRLVGVDSLSQDPPGVRLLPQLGLPAQPDMERLVQLRPDLVLVGRNPAVQQRLQAAGLRVLEVEALTMAEVYSALEAMDEALQQHRAHELWLRMQGRLDRITAEAMGSRAGKPPLRVYLEVDARMYAAAPASFLGELLQRLGGQNIVPDDGSLFPRLTPQEVVRADPDLIIHTHEISERALLRRPGWAQMRAMRQQRLCQLTPSESRAILRPGPRLDVAATVLARCLARCYRQSYAFEPQETHP